MLDYFIKFFLFECADVDTALKLEKENNVCKGIFLNHERETKSKMEICLQDCTSTSSNILFYFPVFCFRILFEMASEDNVASSCLPVRFKIRICALCLWLVLSVPSICVTLILNVFSSPTNRTHSAHSNNIVSKKLYDT